jgi:hypothetical protein
MTRMVEYSTSSWCRCTISRTHSLKDSFPYWITFMVLMPPELLHTSGSGLIMYMFESLCYHLGGGIDCDYIDQEHVVVNNMIKRQSKHDFPCGLMWNGLIVGAKCQSSECKGNLFQLLCIAH